MRPAAIVALIALSAAPALAQELPQRKPGLWETKSSGAEGQTVAKQCVGPGTDQSAVGGLAGGACSKIQVSKTATGYAIETECTVGPIKAAGTSVITGDFDMAIRTEGTTRLSGVPGQTGRWSASSWSKPSASASARQGRSRATSSCRMAR